MKTGDINEKVEKVLTDHKNIIEYFEIFKKFSLIRFVYLPARQKDGTTGSIIIILNDSFSLWFAKSKKTEGWKYDGWEAGDYSERNWEKFQLKGYMNREDK